jgi:glycosyltransferase involved in cell wall biosynthesis
MQENVGVGSSLEGLRPLVVVPCFNEARRWNSEYWQELHESGIDFLFVDDGSTDDTWARIIETSDGSGDLRIQLPANAGKAEAVRLGLLAARRKNRKVVGFLDADAAFPVDTVNLICETAQSRLSGGEWDSVWAARILMGGRTVVRQQSRHYVGRLVATLIASSHGHAVYDTQTGFKLFVNSASLEACLAEPFDTRWFVDFELLMRWRAATGQLMRVWEEPVEGWRDIGGSKVNRGQYVQLARDILTVKRYRSKG